MFVLVTAMIGFLGAAGATTARAEPDPPTAAPGDRWRLVWSDEFDGAVLDPSKWRAENVTLVKNEEQQTYSPDAVTLRDGRLVITSSARAGGGRPFTSGLVETRGLFSRAFGRFEMRAKLPRTRGLWPAFWMLPADESWPPEIDIMEALGHEPAKVYMSNHWGAFPRTDHRTTPFEGPDFSEGFHTFACEWLPDRLDFFVDGELRASHSQQVPRTPFYIILNTAVGGLWPGLADATTRLPQTYEIDYVRVYEEVNADRVCLSAMPTGRNAGGEIIPSPRKWAFSPGERVTLRAEPRPDSRFTRWAGVDDARATDNPLTLTMDANRRVEAVFEPDPAGPRLVSTSAVVTASSAENAQLAPGNVIDGNLGTRWSSAFADHEWIALDLGTERRLRRIDVHWSPLHSPDHRVEVSTDGVRWRTVYEQFRGGGGVQRHAVDAKARHVRVSCDSRSTEWGSAIWEIEVYAD